MDDEKQQGNPHDNGSGGEQRQGPQAERQAVGQVSGQVDDQQEFERFGGLEVNAATAQPGMLIATARVRTKDQGKGGQQQAAGQPDIFIAAQEAQFGRKAQAKQKDQPTDQPTRGSGGNRNRAQGDRW